ncbi:hypothetical protein XccvBFoX4_gp83 [Xanthomonas phage FoX4]|uniref:Uncharacterized protein n=1 Tax=Xanthomonas phage FoX4 TaxID=2723900 RepID=A0A858WM19_9CAUD|nr:hypothetical protein KNU97_gp83 [Xanthomonas phage FoX4]QJI53037.1 hypothetical protein XccvBFoX4_gp83 [Xanthomonas phage FoX4]
MDKKPRGRPPGSTPYTLFLRTAEPGDTFILTDSACGRVDAAAALTARRIGVKVVTSKGVAVYGREAVNVVRVTVVQHV